MKATEGWSVNEIELLLAALYTQLGKHQGSANKSALLGDLEAALAQTVAKMAAH